MSKGKNTVGVVEEIAKPIAEEQGLMIWDIAYQKEGSDWMLKIFVDTNEGITIDQCEAFSRAMSVKLDETDPIQDAYILEVSSPGIERELTKDWHFDQLKGELIQVNLIRPVEGEKKFVGTLEKKEGETVTILLEEDLEMEFLLKEAAWIRKYVEF